MLHNSVVAAAVVVVLVVAGESLNVPSTQIIFWRENIFFILAAILNWMHIQLTTSAVNFSNILRAAFMRADTKSAKKIVKLSSFFVLLGTARVKSACRTLVKLTPGDGWPATWIMDIKVHSRFYDW